MASHSRANYDETPLCMASSLNMEYLDSLARRAGSAGSLEACHEIVNDNAVARHLARLGYRFVYKGSGAGQSTVETADLELNRETETEIPHDSQGSLFRPDPDSPRHHPRYDLHRALITGVFTSLGAASRLPFRKFVFAHVMAPHPPFVFGEDGQAVYPRGAMTLSDASWLRLSYTREAYAKAYIAQLQHVNALTLNAIDTVIKQSKTPPIIVVQGDHGSRMTLDWSSLDHTDVRETFSILNAYYVPKRAERQLYDSISPVNSFRIVLSSVFGEKLALLKDRSYYSTVEEPYKFVDVTEASATTGGKGAAPPVEMRAK